MFPSNAEQPRRISVKEKEGKNTLLLPTPASHFGLQRFQAARGRVSAVFREMTCLCTSAALFGSEAACPGAAPLHFWLTLPSRAWRSLAGAQERCGGGWRGLSPGSLLPGSWDSPNSEQLLKGGGSHRKPSYPLAFGESVLKPTVIKHNMLKPGDGSGPRPGPP